MADLGEVARRVGVATSTASRALNRPELVKPEIVARVRAVAEELGYTPNPFARSLRLQGSKTLGLIVPDNTNPFFAEVAKGIEAACFRVGYTLILCNSDRSLEREREQARVLYEKRVDGVLLFNTSDGSRATVEWLLDRSLPVVLVERRLPGISVDYVISDNVGGVREAIEHLAQLGHRRIACLGGDDRATHYAERLTACRSVMRELGLQVDASLIRAGLVMYADGQRAAIELLAAPAPPTALFCTTDTLAIGALRGAALIRRRVPADVAVVGYGDTEVCAYVQPPLTTVVQQKLAVGTRAVQLVLDRLAERGRGEQSAAQEQVIPTRLVVRESSTVDTEGGRQAPAGIGTAAADGGKMP